MKFVKLVDPVGLIVAVNPEQVLMVRKPVNGPPHAETELVFGGHIQMLSMDMDFVITALESAEK